MPIGRVERHPVLDVPSQPEAVPFSFDGRALEARRSEMISSALIANGISMFGRHHRDGAPQGIFCANGQCSQCLVLADGLPVKACITAVQPGMDVRSMDGLPALRADDLPLRLRRAIPEVATDVLIIGGGPAGLTAAAELGANGVACLLCDDKQTLGGKLSLQTHNFFGSVADCYAGERGHAIGRTLEEKARAPPSVEIWTDSPVVGVFEDGYVGVLKQGRYTLVRPKHLLVAAGAREKALAFAGADLPGVYGAGAFQTLVNRDLVKPSDRLFVVGGGNVGLIVAYQALQAGVDVVGLCEVLPECGGYKVHKDKILRLGIPVFTSHTVLRAEGTDRVERVVLARVDETLRPVPGTEVAFEVDTVLVAVGLSPVNELFREAERLGLSVFAAGDAHEIAEASAAMFSGKIVAREILRAMGVAIATPPDWTTTQALLRTHPGPVLGFYPPPAERTVYPMLRCAQEIPCNPCTEVCITDGIVIPEGNLVGRPKLVGDCVGCLKCVAVCPGLAITLVDLRHDRYRRVARVTVPWEMPDELVRAGQEVPTTGFEGEAVGTGRVLRFLSGKSLNRRRLMVLEVPFADAEKVAGVRVRPPESATVPSLVRPVTDDEVVVCRCERITKQMIVDYVRATGSRDMNAVKAALRSGMGPCGGRTCTELTLRVFRELGVDPRDVKAPVHRPFTQEVPMKAFLVEREAGTGV